MKPKRSVYPSRFRTVKNIKLPPEVMKLLPSENNDDDELVNTESGLLLKKKACSLCTYFCKRNNRKARYICISCKDPICLQCSTPLCKICVGQI